MKKDNETFALGKAARQLQRFDSLMALSEEIKGTLRHYVVDYQNEYTKFYINYLNSRTNIRRVAVFALLLGILISSIYLAVTFIVNRSAISTKSYILEITSSILAFFYLLTLILMIVQIRASSKLRQFTVYHIVRIIINLIYSAEGHPDDWIKFEYKRGLLQDIESIAKYFEDYLPRQLMSGDFVTDDWFKGTTKKIASALREKKKWILTPTKYTRDYFLKNLATTLECILEGDWDGLEWSEIKNHNRQPNRYSIISAFWKSLKILLRAIGLLGFLLVLQRTPWALPGTIYGSLITVAFLYGATVLLSASNSGFNDRVGNVRDIGGLLPLPGLGSKS